MVELCNFMSLAVIGQTTVTLIVSPVTECVRCQAALKTRCTREQLICASVWRSVLECLCKHAYDLVSSLEQICQVTHHTFPAPIDEYAVSCSRQFTHDDQFGGPFDECHPSNRVYMRVSARHCRGSRQKFTDPYVLLLRSTNLSIGLKSAQIQQTNI